MFINFGVIFLRYNCSANYVLLFKSCHYAASSMRGASCRAHHPKRPAETEAPADELLAEPPAVQKFTFILFVLPTFSGDALIFLIFNHDKFASCLEISIINKYTLINTHCSE
jgi:hypothetical protein